MVKLSVFQAGKNACTGSNPVQSQFFRKGCLHVLNYIGYFEEGQNNAEVLQWYVLLPTVLLLLNYIHILKG